MTASVAVFIKYPEPGKVKTRLGKEIGDTAAADLYARMIAHLEEHTFSRLRAPELQVVYLCDPFRPLQDYRDRFAYPLLPQDGPELGARLTHAFRSLFSRSDRVIAVGTDCIDLRPIHLEQALAALSGGSDVVLGPALDGGYYLVGCRKFVPEIFQDIPWSSDQVLSRTLEKIATLNLRVTQLERLRDIDTREDLVGTIFATVS